MGEEEVIDLESRNVYLSAWSLLGQWWCVPADLTAEEEIAFLEKARENICFDKKGCPLEYIRDRMFGGFCCADDENRRHVYFGVGHYSFLAAEEGRFWPLESNERAEQFETLLEHNADQALPEAPGPFCEDSTFIRATFMEAE